VQSLVVQDPCVHEPWRCLALKYVGDEKLQRRLRNRYVKIGAILIDKRLAKCVVDELSCPGSQRIVGKAAQKHRNGQCNWHGGLCLQVYIALLRGRLDYVKSVWPQLEQLLNAVGELNDSRFETCDSNPMACITVTLAAKTLGISDVSVRAMYGHRYVKMGKVLILDTALREIEREILDMVTTKYITAADIVSALPCDNGVIRHLITTILKQHADYVFVNGNGRRLVFYFEHPPGTGQIKPKYLRAMCYHKERRTVRSRKHKSILESVIENVCESDPVKCATPPMALALAGLRTDRYTKSVLKVLEKHYVRVGRIYLYKPIAERIEREVLSLVDKTAVTPTQLMDKLGCRSHRVKLIIAEVLKKHASEVKRMSKGIVARFDSTPQVKEEVVLLKQLCNARNLGPQ